MKKIIKIIFILLVMFSSFYLITLINNLNVLPNKYYYPYLFISIVLNFLVVLLLTRKKRWIKIFGIVLGTILVITSLLGIKYSKTTINYFNKKFNNNTNISSYNVIVLKKSNYQTIEDLSNKTVGYLKKGSYLDELEENIKTKEYNSVNDLYNDLINENIQSMVISSSYLDLLEEQYDHMEDDIRIIYSFDIKHQTTKSDDVKKLESVNILISGSDSRTNYIQNETRSDVNMILTLNPNTKTILLTSIPRDYYVRLHGTNGLKDKLTHSGIYGVDMTKKTLEDLFGIEINYTIKVGFQSVINIVDLIGGIDIYSDASFYSHCGDGGAKRVNVVKGNNHFSGAEALSYARERYAYETGDRHRILNQQQVLEAVMVQIFNNKNILLKYEELLNAFGDFYITDIPSSYIKLLVKQQINDMKSWNIVKQSVDGVGSMGETYSMPGMNLYIMIPNDETVMSAKIKINEVKQG